MDLNIKRKHTFCDVVFNWCQTQSFKTAPEIRLKDFLFSLFRLWKSPRTMSCWTTAGYAWKSPLNFSSTVHRMASRSDRSSNHFSPAMRTNFPRRSGNKDSPSSFHTKLPSRWIKVRSPQVEGGDVGARLRTRDSSVSKSIPGGQTTLWGGKTPVLVRPRWGFRHN